MISNIEQKDQKTNGRWAKGQHQKFLLGLELYGKNWKKIQQLVGTRNGSQIRSHAQKFFLKAGKSMDEGSHVQEDKSIGEQKKLKTVIQKWQQNKEQIAEHSYFMSQIIKAINLHNNINFWQYFIGISSTNSQNQIIAYHRRKDSITSFDICNDSKQETTLFHGNILGESIGQNY